MMLKTRIFTHHPRVSLARFTFCWWRHNWLAMTSQWPDNCDANTWQVISNSLDIDFIHGDIHGRWCKKLIYIFFSDTHQFSRGMMNSMYKSLQNGNLTKVLIWQATKRKSTHITSHYFMHISRFCPVLWRLLSDKIITNAISQMLSRCGISEATRPWHFQPPPLLLWKPSH